jgi:hypothetical protein
MWLVFVSKKFKKKRLGKIMICSNQTWENFNLKLYLHLVKSFSSLDSSSKQVASPLFNRTICIYTMSL